MSPPSLEAESDSGELARPADVERETPGREDERVGLIVTVEDGFEYGTGSDGETLAELDLDTSCRGVDSDIPFNCVRRPFGNAGVLDGGLLLDRASRARFMLANLLEPVEVALADIPALLVFLDRVGFSLVASVISKDG